MKILDDLVKLWDDATGFHGSAALDDAIAVLTDVKSALAFFDGLPLFGAGPPALERIGDGRLRFGKRFFAHRIRQHALKQALADGKTEEQFNAAWSAAHGAGKLSDEVIAGHAVEMGAIGDGTILGVFQKIVAWLSDPANQAAILNIVKFIMTILASFGL